MPQQFDTVMTIYFGVVSFVLGAVCGSFFNVCIYRIPAKKSIIRPGSHCYACGSPIGWFDNIPIISYFLLRGVCRMCGSRFSIRYALVELLTGLLFLGLYWRFGWQLALAGHFVFISLLIIGTFTDIDHFILPDGITIGGTCFAVAAALVLGRHSIVYDEFVLARDLWHSFGEYFQKLPSPPWYAGFFWSIVSAAAGYALLWSIGLLGSILFRKEAMGGGDVKLFAFLGAYLGAINCLWILFLSAILGSCVGLMAILLHKLLHEDAYENIELTPDKAVKIHARTAAPPFAAAGERDTLSVAETVAPAAISLQIARNTARQLHHFPFGPYIAVAAAVVLFSHDIINRFTRERLFLPARQPVEAAVKGTRAVKPIPSRGIR